MVVSEMKERLSPKKAPLTTEPTNSSMRMPVGAASPIAIGTRATIVPTLVPTERLTKHATTNIPGNSRLEGRTCRHTLTIASMAPMPFAACANPPARIKIHTMRSMFSSAAPREKMLMRSSSFRPRSVSRAYTDVMRNTMSMGTLLKPPQKTLSTQKLATIVSSGLRARRPLRFLFLIFPAICALWRLAC